MKVEYFGVRVFINFGSSRSDPEKKLDPLFWCSNITDWIFENFRIINFHFRVSKNI